MYAILIFLAFDCGKIKLCATIYVECDHPRFPSPAITDLTPAVGVSHRQLQKLYQGQVRSN